MRKPGPALRVPSAATGRALPRQWWPIDAVGIARLAGLALPNPAGVTARRTMLRL